MYAPTHAEPVRPQPSPAPRRFDWVMWLIVAYGLAFNLARPLLAGSHAGNLLLDLAFLPVSLVGALLCFRAAGAPALSRQVRRGWRLIGISNLAYWIGDLLWFAMELRLGDTPGTSWADLFYLLQGPLLLAGILGLRPLGGRTGTIRFWLDTFTVMVSGWMVTWYLVLGPIALAQGSDLLARAVAIAYPIMDLVLFVAIAILLVHEAVPVSRAALRTLLLGLLCLFMADLGWGAMTLSNAYETGAWPDSLWMLGQCLLALAAHLQLTGSGREEQGEAPLLRRLAHWRLALMPYTGVVVAYGVLFVAGPASGTELTLLVGATSVTVAVVLRQLLMVKENGRLAWQLQRSEERFRSLVQHSSDVIAVVDGALQITYASPAVEQVLGYEPESLVGTSLRDLLHPDDGTWAVLALAEGETRRLHCRLAHRDGVWRHAETTVNNLLHDPGVAGIVLNMRDVSERKALEDQLRYQAYHDSLTGLANRDLLRTRATMALAQQRERMRPLAVLFLDLDGFKTINDSLGHVVGDQVLKQVSERLRHCLRPHDTVARLGGDEFAVLLQGAGAAEAAVVAERVIREMQAPLAAAGKTVFVGASVGIAISQAGQESADELLRNADMAMYRAKSLGKGCHALFEPTMHLAVMNRLNLEADLRRALEQEEFLIYYQPALNLATGRVRGVEALIRWRHPERGLVAPDQFIPLAEETGLILPLGRWVLLEACKQGLVWQQARQGEEDALLRISVNLSVRQLQDPGLVADVKEALRRYPLAPGSLVLEITEGALVEATESIIGTMEQLRALGVLLAIDDFGTGYSSLSYLSRFPVDVVKIDRSFVHGMGSGERGLALMRGIVELVHALGLITVAEGVEETWQMELLRGFNCRLGQGWLFSRPAPPAEVDICDRQPSSL